MDAARAFGASLAARSIGLVYGGASVGLMGAVADAVLEAKGEVIGVLPRALAAKELAHKGLAQLHLVETMHERKALMADLADGFVALPGGFGTYDELFEALTWAQLRIHEKPIGLLDVAAYFAPLAALFEHTAREGFADSSHLALVVSEADPDRLLERMAAFTPPTLGPKWMTTRQA